MRWKTLGSQVSSPAVEEKSKVQDAELGGGGRERKEGAIRVVGKGNVAECTVKVEARQCHRQRDEDFCENALAVYSQFLLSSSTSSASAPRVADFITTALVPSTACPLTTSAFARTLVLALTPRTTPLAAGTAARERPR